MNEAGSKDAATAGKRVPLNRFIVFFFVAAAGCLIDLWTKSWIFGRLGPPWDRREGDLVVWRDYFNFTTNLNEGGLFGFGQGSSLILAGLSLVAALFILYWLFVAGAARDWLLTLSLALIMAGIFGNLYDRLGIPGMTWPHDPHRAVQRNGERVYAVRDWLDVQYHNHHWPIFNIADSLLVVGAGLLFCQIWRSQGKPASDAAKPADVAASGNSASSQIP